MKHLACVLLCGMIGTAAGQASSPYRTLFPPLTPKPEYATGVVCDDIGRDIWLCDWQELPVRAREPVRLPLAEPLRPDPVWHTCTPAECGYTLEPQVVDAIQVTVNHRICIFSTGNVCNEYGSDKIKEWTCSDPSRFLFTSEDGKRHVCVRF